MRVYRYIGILAAAVLLISGCGMSEGQEDAPVVEAAPTRTATAVPPSPTPTPDTLIVCLADEPDSLYIYSALSREADTVLQAVYDGPYDLLDYSFEPVILEDVPDSSTDAVQVRQVTVTSGDRYLNPESMLPDTFRYGKPYRPAGCSSPQCQQNFVGGEVLMDQMEVQFHLKEGITWSDGEPLTASDSVFSYNLDRDQDTPGSKYVADRTQSYEALDELTTRWISIPGFIDPDYAANFWSPLPEHSLGGVEPSALPEYPEAARSPIGWGPYVIQSWQDGQITLDPNPNYYRASEGLPTFDRLVFRFLGEDSGSAVEQIVTGECDILDEELIPYSSIESLLDLEEQGQVSVSWSAGSIIERIDFNTSPRNGVEPALFNSASTRQAVASCIDREGIADEILYGLAEVPESYIPAAHPLSDPPVSYPSYDPAEANALLEQLGWVEDPDNGVRTARSVWNIPEGTPLSFTLNTIDGVLQRRVAEAIQEDLAKCGIEMKMEYGASADVFAAWPDGPVFSREYSAVLWAWPVFSSPPCEMYESTQIPSDTTRYGVNASGFSNPSYDQACGMVRMGLPTDPAVQQAAGEVEGILAEEVPGIPLYARPRITAYAPDICGVDVNPSAFSVIWNLEEVHRGPACSGSE